MVENAKSLFRSRRARALLAGAETHSPPGATTMRYQNSSRTFNFVVGLVLGLVIGGGIALLTAPQSGSRTRRRIRRAVEGATDGLGERLDEWRGDVRSALGAGRRRFSF